MFLLYNILSDILYFVGVCGLPGHTYDESGFIFLKPGVTSFNFIFMNLVLYSI
jgi:hypothetical protein